MTKLAALLFDVDGTLADTEKEGHLVAFNETFSAAGLDWYWSEELYAELLTITGGKERIQFFVESYHAQLPKQVKDSKELGIFIEKLYREKTQRYIDILSRRDVPLRPGVQRLLTEARQAGLRLAIVTTTNYDNVTALLRYSLHPESIQWFELIAAGDIVKAKKPAADIYSYALNKLNLQPTECLAFEDSENGLNAALGANIPTIITLNVYTETQSFERALAVFNHLGEPDNPCTVIKGDVGNVTYVDVPLLKRLHSQL